MENNQAPETGYIHSRDIVSKARIGDTCRIYGTITDVIATIPEQTVVVIDGGIRANLLLNSSQEVEYLKEHAFEPAFFEVEVSSKEDNQISVNCKTVFLRKRLAPLV